MIGARYSSTKSYSKSKPAPKRSKNYSFVRQLRPQILVLQNRLILFDVLLELLVVLQWDPTQLYTL